MGDPHGALCFDEHGASSLDGTWDFFPGDHSLSELDALPPQQIAVPGLWEAQGYLELDGPAWYRRRFVVPDTGGWWTMRFGAVMDFCSVYLNGTLIGSHDQPFTPFEVDPGPALAPDNVLAVRVIDPPLSDPDHIRSAHGKQGWANHVFPSRPSLYMTYGGIWQSVQIRRHGPVTVDDVFVNSDPDDLQLTIELRNRSDDAVEVDLGIRAVREVRRLDVVVEPGPTPTVVVVSLGRSTAPRWSPQSPRLHLASVDAVLDDRSLSDSRTVRFGLRTVRVEGDRILLNAEPYRMKSVLVQGFRAEELYAEGSREAILDEVLAARSMGFNTLRLHIKAFDPTYLDVCDEVGMLLECDIPVAEPIAHEELGDGTLVSARCAAAVSQQIRRDRNHPSVILWAVMNELGLDREGVRSWDVYEQFARTLMAAATAADPTRPAIENEWVEPDPDRVFVSPILTAHWYGRLHADYLSKLDRQCAACGGQGRPVLCSEFGDWGLPAMPVIPNPPFWDTHDLYAAGLAGSLWPASISRFVAETQRYQGLSDRLQIETFRRHDHIGGYVLTELTDVPHELNGLLDLHRRPKPLAVAEIVRANQPVLPMLHLESLVVEAGGVIRAPLHVANDGPELADVEVEIRFGGAPGSMSGTSPLGPDASALPASSVLTRLGETLAAVRRDRLPASRAVELGPIHLVAPTVPGSHDLVVTLRSAGRAVSVNSYPIHVVAPPRSSAAVVRVVGDGRASDALATIGVTAGNIGPVLVAEGALDAGAGASIKELLAEGAAVVILAQQPAAAEHYPFQVRLESVATEWGSSVFHFTGDDGTLPSLPRRNVLVAEDSTIQATSIVTQVEAAQFPARPVVLAYKPHPGAVTGTVVGAHQLAHGRVIFCQYRLTDRAASGDAAARAMLGDLITWAATPPDRLACRSTVRPDGRTVSYYTTETGT
ncbi:MAG TPA: glycoside hydrolase family 2 TIM barrel-domain containing protein [Mycobacteriales bacterium]|nr:glycoside hydrolase family 2 TIM barrel-domain containing protein [Mycobacteriales bacterium]